MLVVIAYDIPSDRRRTRVARLLEGVADRVQYSVFEGDLDDNTLRATQRRLERLIDSREDTVRIYRICATCKAQTVLLGQGCLVVVPDVIVL